MRWSIILGLWAVFLAGPALSESRNPLPAQPILSPVEDRGAISAKFHRPPPPPSTSRNDGPLPVVVGRLPQVPPIVLVPTPPTEDPAQVVEVQVTTYVEERPTYYFPYRPYREKHHKGHKSHKDGKPHKGDKHYKKSKTGYKRPSRTWGWARGNNRRTVDRWRRMARQ